MFLQGDGFKDEYNDFSFPLDFAERNVKNNELMRN